MNTKIENAVKRIGIIMSIIIGVFIIESVRVLYVFERLPREVVQAVIEARGGEDDVIGIVRYWEEHGQEIVGDMARAYEFDEYHRQMRYEMELSGCEDEDLY